MDDSLGNATAPVGFVGWQLWVRWKDTQLPGGPEPERGHSPTSTSRPRPTLQRAEGVRGSRETKMRVPDPVLSGPPIRPRGPSFPTLRSSSLQLKDHKQRRTGTSPHCARVFPSELSDRRQKVDCSWVGEISVYKHGFSLHRCSLHSGLRMPAQDLSWVSLFKCPNPCKGLVSGCVHFAQY